MFVGLDLAFNGVNYGMLLQAYATQVVFDAMGDALQVKNSFQIFKRKILCFEKRWQTSLDCVDYMTWSNAMDMRIFARLEKSMTQWW